MSPTERAKLGHRMSKLVRREALIVFTYPVFFLESQNGGIVFRSFAFLVVEIDVVLGILVILGGVKRQAV